MPEQRQLTFRRVRGRIIPIRLKKDDKLKQGALAVAGGAAVGVATAELASQATKRAAGYRLKSGKSFRQANQILAGAQKGGQLLLDLGGDAGKAKALRQASTIMRHRATLLRKIRSPLLIAGTTIAGVLIGKGIEQIQESVTNKEMGIIGEGASQGAGALVSSGILGLYYKRLGLRSFTKAFRYAKAAASGTKHKLPKIPITTKHGTLKF